MAITGLRHLLAAQTLPKAASTPGVLGLSTTLSRFRIQPSTVFDCSVKPAGSSKMLFTSSTDADAHSQQLLRLQEPIGLRSASSTEELERVLPFSYEMGVHRQRSFESRRLHVRYMPQSHEQQGPNGSTPTTPEDAPARRPADSFLEIIYPFSSHAQLREQYQRFTSNRLRFGLLLEDLDTLAGDIAARHTGLDQRSLVTAAIDRISWMGVPHSSCTPWVSSARHINPVVNNTSSSGLASGSSRASAQSTVAGPTALPTTPYTLGNGQEAVCMSSSTDGRDGLDAVEPIISLFRDLRLAGQVTWVGKSSLEVVIELCCRKASTPHRMHAAPHSRTAITSSGADNSSSHSISGCGSNTVQSSHSSSDEWNLVGVARFVMVSRRADMTGGLAVPLLRLETEHDRCLFASGEAHMEERQRKREQHLERVPPSAQEIAIVHDLLRNHAFFGATGGSTSDPASLGHGGSQGEHGLSGGRSSSKSGIPMRRTAQQTSCLMHSQDRNRFNAIFGGHLLRLAFEHAFVTAALYAGEWCDPVSMDDVAFLLPVPIGVLMRLSAHVVFTSGRVVRVHVRASKLTPGAPEQPVVTNVFSFAFLASSSVRPVVPETMVEALAFVMGQRQHEADQSSSTLAARSSTYVMQTSRL